MLTVRLLRLGSAQRPLEQKCLSVLTLETARSYAKKAKQPRSRSIGEEEEQILDTKKLRSSMDAVINALKWEYSNSLITRFTPALLERVAVEVEGRQVPLREVAQVGMPTPQSLLINLSGHPQVVEATVKAVRDLGLNLNPVTEKTVVKVPVPRMTKEQRERLVKLAKSHAENAKVGIRRVRQRGISDSRKKKSEVSEDALRRVEKYIQEITGEYTASVDELLKAKSSELMKP